MQTTAINDFHALGLSESLLRNLTKAGFFQPTSIQAQAIPYGAAGRDVIGCAQTGTGKTAAFVIPMIERLALLPKGHPHGLILVPTRELAMQVQETIDKLTSQTRMSATTIVGGADMQAQVRGLRQRPDILVATPGRLLDHMWNGTINVAAIQILVLDEADRMLDMGFAAQINQILDALPEERQTLLFSATMPNDLTRLAQTNLKNPVHVMVAPPATTADGIAQGVHHTNHHEKTDLLLSLLGQDRETVLVFTRTKHRADRVGEVLIKAGHKATVLHGNLSLSQRRRALDGFKRGTFRVLVATDIAARGIDVANIGHVINYDMPNCAEDYVHRIGRTGRMKAMGRATSFVTAEDHGQLHAIEKLLGSRVPLAKGSREPVASHHLNVRRDVRPSHPSRRSSRSRGAGPRPGAPSGHHARPRHDHPHGAPTSSR